jgi:S-adenosylmethionine synthetase
MVKHLFTSESVASGHPDKVCDQISDAILDAMMAQDRNSRVACEVMVATGMVVVAGEVTTKAIVDIPALVRSVIRDIGYTDPTIGFDAKSCSVLLALNKQSPDISLGVTAATNRKKEQGAGDQGMMFGYACNETPQLMPAAIQFAHQLMQRLQKVRESGEMPYLRPDGKGQVTVEYEGDRVRRIHTVVISNQHKPEVSQARIRRDMINKVIKKVLPARLLDARTIYHVNPTGRFVTGGPHGDSGLTGRKIIVDTYGGSGAHGGGAFSGKDPSKVDRSAAYAARYIAKNLVKAKAARRVQVQLAYAIGVAAPVSVAVDTFGTAAKGLTDERIARVIPALFPLKPREIIEYFKLLRPIYRQTATHGHFGRAGKDFTWEKTDKAAAVRKALKMK